VWKPKEKVGKNEHMGRRLFQRRNLVGAADQTRPNQVFELYHFEETRDREVSLDRLGETNVDGKVKAYLDPRAQLAATRFKRRFQGWAVVKADKLQNPSKGAKLQVVPSPIPMQAGEDLSDNVFHAHVEMPEDYSSYFTALHLKLIFETNFRFEASSEPKRSRGIFIRAFAWAGKFLGRRGSL
jgi:hypothetical protein